MGKYELLKFILINAGISIIITKGYIFEWIKVYFKTRSMFFYMLFKCPLCMGFWTSLFAIHFTGVDIFSMEIKDIFSYCCIGSITSLMIASFSKN